jgi:Holliday junction resolvase
MNKHQKGNRTKLKIKRYFERLGYQVGDLEKSGRFIKQKDVFGADIVIMNEKKIIFIQCKSNKNDVPKGKKEFQKYFFPSEVEKWIVLWEDYEKNPKILFL